MSAKRIKATLSFSPSGIWTLPADAESYAQMVNQFWNRCLRVYDAGGSMAQAVRAGFKEIGITPPKPRTGRKGSK